MAASRLLGNMPTSGKISSCNQSKNIDGPTANNSLFHVELNTNPHIL